MSRRPTAAEASTESKRVDNFGDVLKAPDDHGPSYVQGSRANTAEYPVYPRYEYPDEREKDLQKNLKQKMAQSGAYGQVYADQSDIDYVISKREQADLVKLKRFTENIIPRGTPWAKEYFEKIYPGWYQEATDVINEKLDVVQKYLELTVTGVQSMEDVRFLFYLATGRITIPDNWKQLIRPDNQGVDEKYYASGLFSPRRFLGPVQNMSNDFIGRLSNIPIPGIDMKNLANTDSIFTDAPLFSEGPDSAVLPSGATANATNAFNISRGVKRFDQEPIFTTGNRRGVSYPTADAANRGDSMGSRYAQGRR